MDLGFAVMASSELPPIGLSPLYAPPEWMPHESPRPEWDVWSLGAILHELLTGRPVRYGDADDVSPLALGGLARAMLHADPSQRPTMREVRAHLGQGPLLRPDRRPVKHQEELLERLGVHAQGGLHLPRVIVLHGPSSSERSTVLRAMEQLHLTRVGYQQVVSVYCSGFDPLPYRVLDPLAEGLGPGEVEQRQLARLLAGAGARVTVSPSKGEKDAYEEVLDVLTSMLRRQPTAILVDDAEYGDTESAYALGEVISRLADEGAPSLVVLAQAELHSEFREALENIASLSAVDVVAVEMPARSARELSGGYAAELARDRGLDALHPSAQGVLLLAAIEAEILLAEAAEFLSVSSAEVFSAVSVLREENVLTTHLTPQGPAFAVRSEPVRQRLLEVASPSALKDAHRFLATQTSDPVRVARHLAEAGDVGQATLILRRLARRASALKQWPLAARHWSKVDALSGLDREERLLCAESMSKCGRGQTAAEMWRRVSDEISDPREKQRLRVRAAASLLGAGYGREGIRRLLEAVEPSEAWVPRTRRDAAERIRASLTDGETKLDYGPTVPISSEVRLQLDALYAATTGFAMWDPIRSGGAQVEFLHRSLETGSRSHLLQAMCIHLIQRSGRFYDLDRTEHIRARLEGLAQEVGDEQAMLLRDIGFAGSAWMEGRTEEHIRYAQAGVARQALEEVDPWLRGSFKLMLLTALVAQGRVGELRTLGRVLQRDAQDREDRYMGSNIMVHAASWWGLADDRPAQVLAQLRQALEPWKKAGRSMLWMFASFQWVRALISAGRLEEASESHGHLARRLKGSLLWTLDTHRAQFAELEAVLAGRWVETHGLEDARARSYLAQARSSLDEHLSRPSSEEHRIALEARVLAASGGSEKAAALREEARQRAATRGALAFAEALAIVGEKGEDAASRMRRLGVRSPQTLVRALVP
ncbi:MAG: hypothetical protein AAFZ18_30600 [Myxococcota bacterium]